MILFLNQKRTRPKNSRRAAGLARSSSRASSRRMEERRKAPRKADGGLNFLVYIPICLLLFGFFSVSLKLFWVGTVPVSEPSETSTLATLKELPKRGDIYDRNGILLSTTLKVQSLYADPMMMLDTEDAIERLSTVLPNLDREALRQHLSNPKRRFAWIKRQLTPKEVKAVNDLGIPGLAFRTEEARLYPQKNLLSHVLGGIGVDDKGLAGIEKSYDGALSRGEDIQLTLDVRLQEQLRTALVEQMAETEAKSVWGVVIDPKTADVLAMVSLPDYDPNHYGSAQEEAWMNKVTSGVYEMGSTFKTFTIAQGFEKHLLTEETEFDCTKPVRVGRYTIRDSHPKYKWLSVKEIFQRSSNVGAARIADTFTQGSQMEFFDSLGLLSDMDIGLGPMAKPQYPSHVGRVHTMSMSYGHGIAVTPMHLVSAIAAISGDGVYRMPHVVKNTVRQTPHRVVGADTVEFVQSMMQNVVENGTGRRSHVAGYAIGGKTGTSEKAVAGGYSKSKNIASFVGIIPANDPQYVGLVMVDEGKEDFNSGGSAAAPAFAKFVSKMAPVVGLRPTEFEAQYAERYVEERFSHASLGPVW